MIRTFCDCCGEEITERNRIPESESNRLQAYVLGNLNGVRKSIKVEVITSYNGITNAGDFCKYCVLDALYKLDDRPKEANNG